MAEIFAVASGALSVAGFAGQLAQSATFLHGFVKDIKDAPEIVKRLGLELRLLTSILLDVQNSHGSSEGELRHALQYCGKRLDELILLVRKIDPAQYTQKRKRMWKHCQVALERSDLTNYLAELDHCKMMLIQACSTSFRYVKRCLAGADKTPGWIRRPLKPPNPTICFVGTEEPC